MSVHDKLRQIFRTPDESIRPILLGVAALIVFIVFSSWSGVPSGERPLPFWMGVAVLAITLLTFAWVAWYLLLKPLPIGRITEQPIQSSYRQVLALLLGVG